MISANEVYEGNQPFVFISYSHKDSDKCAEIRRILDCEHIRYWYDNGLNSGDDWNLVIAQHLIKAEVCLVLMSGDAAASEYVKNELNLAFNHRVKIQTLMLHQFDLPLDVELMLGRYQRYDSEAIETRVIKCLPAGVYDNDHAHESNEDKHHALFALGELVDFRQGTLSFRGCHRFLNYPCLIQINEIKPSDEAESIRLSKTAIALNNTAFPMILDACIENGRMTTYYLSSDCRFLESELELREFEADYVAELAKQMVNAMAVLFSKKLTLRDLAHGSLMLNTSGDLRIIRLNDPFYGLVRLSPETYDYYFNNTLQEIAIFIHQLCTGKSPVLPLRCIAEQRFAKSFNERMNLVIQKCVKVEGRCLYRNFGEIIADLNGDRIGLSDKRFLNERRKRIDAYQKACIRRKNALAIADNETVAFDQSSVENKYGFDQTVIILDDSNNSRALKPQIRIIICANGNLFETEKTRIMIGRDHECDLVWNQAIVSRFHCEVTKIDSDNYIVKDMNSKRGIDVYLEDGSVETLLNGESISIRSGTIFSIAGFQMKIIE